MGRGCIVQSPLLSSQFFDITKTVFLDDQVIPGRAGKDYPIFSQSLLQKRRFACRGLRGYFADVSSRCQVNTKPNTAPPPNYFQNKIQKPNIHRLFQK